jgi:hypothetical protein
MRMKGRGSDTGGAGVPLRPVNGATISPTLANSEEECARLVEGRRECRRSARAATILCLIDVRASSEERPTTQDAALRGLTIRAGRPVWIAVWADKHLAVSAGIQGTPSPRTAQPCSTDLAFDFGFNRLASTRPVMVCFTR